MRIASRFGLLLLLSISRCCPDGAFAQQSHYDANKEEEQQQRQGNIRGGTVRNDSNHKEGPAAGKTNLQLVGKVPVPVEAQGQIDEGSTERQEFSDKPLTQKDLVMGPPPSPPVQAQKQSQEQNQESYVKETKTKTHNKDNAPERANTHRRNRTNRGLTADTKQHKECPPPAVQYNVICKDHAEDDCYKELEEQGVEFIHMLPGTDIFTVCVDSEQDWEILMGLADVEDVEEDPERSLKDIPEMDIPGSRRRLQQEIPYGINLVRAPEFWSTYSNQGEQLRNGQRVKVCVVDTGLNADHRDLQGTVRGGSNDGDLVTPWDEDGDGHGTHVAGTVAASDNGLDVVGVAPGAELFIARVFGNNGNFRASSLIDAMNECARGGSNIISMSLGGPGSSNAERLAVEQLTNSGILLVAAAGNSGNTDNPLEFPSGYDAVMSVAAIDSGSRIANFSSHNDAVDIAAPGVAVESLQTQDDPRARTFTTFKSGTSMATPHVSGVAALLMSQFPNEPTARIRQAMENSAIDVGACGLDKLFGHGIVDVIAAANYLENGSTRRRDLQAGCVAATVNTRTDDYGQETQWFVVEKASANAPRGDILVRGGPYRNGVRVSYTETFFLPSDGCFEFVVEDRFNDGTCCRYGQGSHEFIFQGQRLLFSDTFERGELSVTFGCGNSDNGGGGGGGSAPVCGDGVVEGAEECDLGGNNDDRGDCTTSCRLPRCGDGFVQSGEECDLGNQNNNRGSCTANCRNARCGDGFVQPGEECDEGNRNSNQGSCTLSCRDARCGDGFVQTGVEQCDNGNQNNNSGSCTASCQNARCGDGFIQAGEECDDGPRNNDQTGSCSTSCTIRNNSSGGGPSTSCTGGLASATLALTTDTWSFWQNELFFFDFDSPPNEFVWYATRLGLESNARYGSEVCLDPNRCYGFYFFDRFGDGLLTGGLTFSWNGVRQVFVEPGDTGAIWEAGRRMTFWFASVGNCAAA